jgi:hypothetical protein
MSYKNLKSASNKQKSRDERNLIVEVLSDFAIGRRTVIRLKK